MSAVKIQATWKKRLREFHEDELFNNFDDQENLDEETALKGSLQATIQEIQDADTRRRSN